MRHQFRHLLWVSLAILMTGSLTAADEKKDSAEQDFAGELPRIPAKSPQESLKAIHLKQGFHAELVACEPLIRSPMAMDFDEFGRAFVVELPEYNQYASPKPHGKGAIKRLEDTDNDGQYDTATVYVDDLDYPTAVACWDGGVLVGVAPDILYCKDTDGDGKADVRQKLFTGFGQDKAGEGMLNSFRWRIDNRFHIPTGLDGGEVVAVTVDGNESAKINVRGQHLLLDPRNRTITATSGGGQHGMSLDDWNFHGFVCGNSEPAHLIMYDGRYLARNPYLTAPAASINIAPDGKFTKLMRISEVEPWRILRTRLRKQGVIPGSDEGGTPSGFFTGATGITVYRGDAWPSEYRGNLFVGEVANNLVYRARLEPNGVGLTAHRADTDAEFLASTDNWFRPVQFANAPDGTLYVLDMSRELIEGAAFLAPQILKHMDTSAGYDKGRIYRIAPTGYQFRPTPRLGDVSTAELVKLYEHPNGWHRDTASRLIYQRQDKAAVQPLLSLAEKSTSPLARVMSLYSLQGLAALDPELVTQALRSKESPVRQHALRLAESWTDQPEVRAAVLALADDADLRVRYQAAYSLGAFTGDSVTQKLAQIAVNEGADPWLQLAVLSSIGERRGEFFTALISDRKTRQAAHVRAMILLLAAQMGAANGKQELAVFLKQVDALPADEQPLAADLMKTIIAVRPAIRDMLGDGTGDKTKTILAGLIREAHHAAGDDKKEPAERAVAVRTLAAAKFADIEELFSNLLASKQPQPVQAAALETLARFDSPQIPKLIQEAWPSLTPQLRATAMETWFTRPAWIAVFLDAVESEAISRTDIDPARIALLQKSEHKDLRERTAKLFANAALARRQDVVDAYQKSLELKGNLDQGRLVFRKSCAACHKLEGFGESIGADLNAIKDRGLAAVMLNILDPNREVKPQFQAYVVALEEGVTVTGMITGETANSLTLRKADGTSQSILRVKIDELKSTNLSFMPEGLEKQIPPQAMADLLAYLNSIK
jgi:putative membrane-bound dehydrogenase-like protein